MGYSNLTIDFAKNTEGSAATAKQFHEKYQPQTGSCFSLPTKPKLRSYCKFKCSKGTEDYVIQCKNRYERSLIAQIRSGILPLNIELGRFGNIFLENRLCLLCNNDCIEDEFHFVMQSEFHNNPDL